MKPQVGSDVQLRVTARCPATVSRSKGTPGARDDSCRPGRDLEHRGPPPRPGL